MGTTLFSQEPQTLLAMVIINIIKMMIMIMILMKMMNMKLFIAVKLMMPLNLKSV